MFLRILFIVTFLMGCGKTLASKNIDSTFASPTNDSHAHPEESSQGSSTFSIKLNTTPGKAKVDDPTDIPTLIYYANGVAYPVFLKVDYGRYIFSTLRGKVPYQLAGQNICLHYSNRIIENSYETIFTSNESAPDFFVCGKASIGGNLELYKWRKAYYTLPRMVDPVTKEFRSLNIISTALKPEQLKSILGSHLIHGETITDVSSIKRTPYAAPTECYFNYGHENRNWELESFGSIFLTCTNYEIDKKTCESLSAENYPFTLYYRLGAMRGVTGINPAYYERKYSTSTSAKDVCLSILNHYFYKSSLVWTQQKIPF